MVSVLVLGILLGQDPITVLEQEMEKREWSAPKTSVPESVIKTAKFLFAHGLADPAGGELRRAKVATYSSSMGTRYETEVAGWVLPGQSDPSLIVDMNGLLYQILEVGDLVTVAELQEGNAAPPMRGYSRWGGGNDPRNGLIAVALLLKTGHVKEAEKIYADNYKGKGLSDEATMIEQYAIRRFHRAIGAHMFGDDELSLRDATSLARHREDLKEAYLDNPPKGLVVMREGALAYLNIVPDLRNDAQHRVIVHRKRLDLSSLEDVEEQRRAEILIQHLNDATARQMMQPGGVSMGDAAIVRALIEIGEPAVDKLLDAYDRDTRFTRSVSYGRDFFPGRRILTVKDAAYAALASILEHPAIGYSRGRPTAFELRAYWRVFKDVPLVERKYHELADDVATPTQWLAATQYLTDRTNVKRIGSWIKREQIIEGQVRQMKGEELRDGRAPSISELMALRVTQIGYPTDYNSSTSFFELSDAVRMAMMLFEWDPVGSEGALKHLTQRFKEAVLSEDGLTYASRYRRHSIYSRIPNLSFLTVCRLRLGDRSAVQDYVDIVSVVGYESGFNQVETRFAPLILFPDEDGFKSLAEELFGTEGSPWHPSSLHFSLSGNEFETRLMGVAPFRRESLKLLRDKRVIGSVSFKANGYRYELESGGSGGYGLRPEDAAKLGVTETESQDLRVCDVVAFALSRFQGAPLFSPVWSDERRFTAIEEIEKFAGENAEMLADLIPEQLGPLRNTWMTNEPIKR